MSKQRPFAGELNPDDSYTLWYEAPEGSECICQAKPDEAHARLCPCAPRVSTRPAGACKLYRTREAHIQDNARTAGLTDVAERYYEALERYYA